MNYLAGGHLDADPSPAMTSSSLPPSMDTTSSSSSAMDQDGTVASPLFTEYYDDWQTFDQAVATAIAKHHPLRKRSSLTFDVYNRTVSKGRHDRKPIAEFLSKTYKCTHGIKFRSRGNGKRLRHKLRDIGCPFHVYATAIEYGDSYRVKVRTHDQHNHPIGPDAMKNLQAFQESDYDFATSTAHEGVQEGAGNVSAAAVAAAASIVAAPTSALTSVMESPNGASVLHSSSQTALHAQMMDIHTSASHSHAHGGRSGHETTAQSADLLDASVHDSDALLDGAIESSIGDFGAASGALATTKTMNKFEETTTLEGLRRSIAQFAAEREWDQFHTPRNLLLALTGEVGELCEIFQWKGDDQRSVDDWPAEEREHLGEELSDVIIYLIRLADKCNIDLPSAIQDKMVKNARKYPAELVRGSSKKYNEYKKMRLDKVTTI